MTQETCRMMFGSTPERFKHRVAFALSQTQAQPARRRVRLRAVLLTVVVLALLAAAAYAAFSSQVSAFFGRLYGSDMRDWLQKGDAATSERTFVLDGVLFTLDEVVYRNGGLYGVGTIRPQADRSIVIIPEDHTPDEPYGYDVYGEGGRPEVAPDGAPSVADMVRKLGGKLLVVRALPDEIGVDGGEMLAPDCIGSTFMPQRDGSIRYSFEVSNTFAVEEGELYTIRMWSSVCEMTVDGETMENTRHGKNWTAEIRPEPIRDLEKER